MEIIIDNIDNYDDSDYFKFLNDIKLEKKNKINKLVNTVRKKESILGEKLFIDNLFKIYGIVYSEIKIKYNINGKPYIDSYNNIYYNIGHSHGIVVIVFNNTPIGVDIEKIRKTNINVINQFATKNEKKYIMNNQNNNINIVEKIFKIYTLKEAYFKMKGANLNYIKDIEFIVNNDCILCSDKNVSIKQVDTLKNYIISVCSYI